MNWLLDTNLISETRKPKPHLPVLNWLRSVKLQHIHTTTINIAELVYGAECQSDLIKRRELFRWIDDDIRSWLSGRIHEVSERELVRWRHIARESDLKQQPAPATDLLIVAVALERNLRVATRDIAPFVASGVPTFNPWTGERFNGA
jgi:toxin FitB